MPADVVLLIDLENMIGANPRSATLAAKLDALTTRAGTGVPAVAACAGNRINPAGKQVLQDRNIRLLTVGGDKDATDKALLAEAGMLASTGCTRFFVTSHDSRFAEVADLGELEIIAWTNPKIAQKYTARAVTVHQVPRPAPVPAAKSATSAKPAQPAKTQPESAQTAGRAHARVPASPGTGPRVTAPRITVASAVVVGTGVLAAGILLGAGTVLGASAVLRLLQPTGRPRHRSGG